MSNKQDFKESLSALLDDELGKTDELELRRLIKACAEDGELVAAYERYTMVSSALAGENYASSSLVSKVSSAIAAEEMDAESPDVTEQTQESGWKKVFPLKAMGQFAVAASVAVLVVSTVQWGGVSDGQSPQGLAGVDATNVEQAPQQVAQNRRVLSPNVVAVNAGENLSAAEGVETASTAKPISITAAQLEQQRRARMQKYLMYHLEHASLNDNRGMMPFARVSYFEEGR